VHYATTYYVFWPPHQIPVQESDLMLLKYIPILIWICLTVGLAAAILIVSHLIGRKRPSKEKLSPYECGMPPTGDARIRIPIKFYMVAVIFLIFDIEAAFLYPWAVVYRKMLFVGLLEMGVFMVILFAGFVYIWKRGVLDWED
jgi:NADH-quinone oxidoreductase subunit A